MSRRRLYAAAALASWAAGCGGATPGADAGSMMDAGPSRDRPAAIDAPPADRALDDAGVSSPPPTYRDPPWSEPAAPGDDVVRAAVLDAQQAAAARLGAGDVAALRTRAAAADPGALAIAQVHDLRFDAATWLFAEAHGATPRASTLASLAGLEALRGADGLARSELLARAALARVAEPSSRPVAHRRVVASAWSNLGRARHRRGEFAGAIAAYRQALALFPGDSRYLTGLAAALSGADLTIPGYLAALRAVSQEVIADPTLVETPRDTPARAWALALRARVASAASPEAGERGGSSGASPGAFPEAGGEVLGLRVTSRDASGNTVLSPPAFVAHGLGHVSDTFACMPRSATNLHLRCNGRLDPMTPAGEALGRWAPVPWETSLITLRPSNLTPMCATALADHLDRSAEPLRVFAPRGAAFGALDGALRTRFEEYMRSFGLSISGASEVSPLTGLEVCNRFVSASGAVNAALATLTAAGPGCADTCTPACDSWARGYRDACDAMLRESTRLAASEEAHARADDAVMQANIERSVTLSVALGARSRTEGACRDGALCGFAVEADDHRWAYASFVGGRSPRFLSSLRAQPALEYLRCVQAIPPSCPASGGPGARGERGQVACICLGIGPVAYCLQADGAVEVRLSMGLGGSVGVRANLNKGLDSVRLGAGVGAMLSVGAFSGGVSAMVWYDTSTGRFAPVEYSAGLDVNIPGGGSVGTSPTCDAWQRDAPPRELDLDGTFVEATTPAPGG